MKQKLKDMKKAIIKTITPLVLTCLINSSIAQSIKITGTVNDNISKQVLPNATVTIKNINDNNFHTSAVTNNKGSFLINVPKTGIYKIEVSYLGYQNNIQDSVLIDEQHTGISAFYMLLAGKDLKTVTVAAAKKPFITMGANKITLNVAQSAIAAGGNAYDVLKNAPGILEQNDALNFRGKSINVLINGRPSNLSGEDLKNMLSNMQASGIEKIEILPNPSAKYDATGGSVVNIVLVKNKLFGTNYFLTTTMGTGKNLRGGTGLDINHRAKNMNVFGGYNFNHNQQYYQTNSTRYLGNGTISADEYDIRERNNHAYKLGVDYDISKHSSFGGLINGYVNYRNRYVTNISVLHFDGNTSDSASKVFTKGKAVFTNPSLNLYYKTTLDTTGKELTINADYLNYNKTWYDDFTNRYYDNKGMEYVKPDYLKDNSPASINVYALTADLVMPTKKARWEAGIKISYTVTDNDVSWEYNNGISWFIDTGKTNYFIYKENVNAAYLNYIRTVKKWDLQAGLRVEQTNTKGNSVTAGRVDKKNYASIFPFVEALYKKNAKNELSISYRKSIQRFGFDYVNPFIIYKNQYAYSSGNPNLQPQVNHQFSISYSLQQSTHIGIEYAHAIKSLGISFYAQNNITVTGYANFKSSDVVYAYLNYSKKLFSLWQMNAYLYSGYFNYNVNTTTYIQKQNNNKPFFGLQVSNNLSFKKGFSVECSISYRSSLVSGIFKTNSYYTADIGINKSILKSKINLKLSVSDILNTQKANSRVDYQGVNMMSNSKTESRFLNLSLKYNFGNKNIRAKREKQSKISEIKNRIN